MIKTKLIMKGLTIMNFKTIENDMKNAWKSGNMDKKKALANLIGNIKKIAIDEGCRENISDEIVDKAILKELKTINEQIDTCPSDRFDLLNEYRTARNVISEYAPKMMSYDEIKTFIVNKFSEILSSKNKGLIMKNIMPELKGKADGKLINSVVADLLKNIG